MRRIGSLVAIALLLLGACEKKEPPSGKDTLPALPGDRLASLDALVRGARLYQENCAQCHGPEAQGHPDWRNPQVIAAPPLDGSGNAWKRSRQDLIAIVKNGASRNGVPAMPAWNGRLSDQDIGDITAWYQALWPAEVYDRWRKANAAPAAPKG